MDEFARDYGISQSQAFNWLKRNDPPLGKHWEPLAKFFGVSKDFLVTGIPQKLESPSEYATEHGSIESSLVEDRPADGARKKVNEPSVQQCMDHLASYLERARREIGGVGYTYRLLKKHLPLDEFEAPPGPLVPVILPSQTQLLSTETGKPVPNPSRHARPA